MSPPPLAAAGCRALALLLLVAMAAGTQFTWLYWYKKYNG
jgi:hypothetical protein